MRTIILILALCCLSVPIAAGADTITLLSESLTWLDTKADNSLERKATLFDEIRKNGRLQIFTASEKTNIHSHYRGVGASSFTNYTYTGRMRIADENGGIGVTFYSRYPLSDRYYRLRRFSGTETFHIAPHGTSITSGVTDTGVAPLPGPWYRFKVKVKSIADATQIQAKVWRSGTKEPRAWQVECLDENDSRVFGGSPGIWSMGQGKKQWDNLRISR